MIRPEPEVFSAPDGVSDASSGLSGRLRLVVGLLIGAGAIYAVVSSAGGFASSLGALGSARPGWLAGGGLAEAASFAALGLLLRRLVGDQVSRVTGVRLGLVVAGLGNILPAAPAEGLVMASAELHRRGVDPRRSRIALGLMQWLSIRTLFGIAALDALAVAGVAMVRYPQQAPGREILAALAVVILAVLAATAWLASRQRPAPDRPGRDPRLPGSRHAPTRRGRHRGADPAPYGGRRSRPTSHPACPACPTGPRRPTHCPTHPKGRVLTGRQGTARRCNV